MTPAEPPSPHHASSLHRARWAQIEPIFDRALELAGAERDNYLTSATSNDAVLRAEIEAMLHAATSAGLLLDGSVLERFDALISQASAPPADDEGESMLGRQVGPFRIVRELGRGGMGVVYLAERDDAQFAQRVALKLVKRGMDTDFVLRRFRAERQILASLSHPNIARLLDGGTTSDGRPYFVMEFIEGKRIDQYVSDAALPLSDRLTLFLRLCDAVGYAHQQLVVHRDIKPANIMVTADGVPKLLDFGIASLLDEEGAGTTATAIRALTPEYASPEQAEGKRAGTVSDVYSLGVVLYELLTGDVPHRFRSREPQEIAAQLRATEPTRPSDAARARARPWQRRLRGDLDTITMLALRAEPDRRYGSVEALATDLRRHLDGVPVRAQASSAMYRAGKFIRRNRGLVAAGSAIILTMVAGSIATAWQARVATQQAARAERRFNDLRALAHAVLFDYHDAVVNLPGSTPVRARLVKDGLAYLDELNAEASDDPSLQLELAQAYRRMGDVQGGSMRNNLGNSTGAIASYQKSLVILGALMRSDSANVATRETLSGVLSEIGVLFWETGDLPAARDALQRAQRLLVDRLAARPRDATLRMQMNQRHDYLGQIEYAMGNGKQARTEYATALAVLDSLPPSDRVTASIRRAYSVTLQHYGEALADAGEGDAALRTSQRVLDLRKGLAREEPLNAELQRALAVAYYYQGESLARVKRYRDALESYREDLAISLSLEKADPGNALYRGDAEYALTRLGDMSVAAGDMADAIRNYEASYRMHQQDVAADSTNLWKRAAMIEAQAKIAESHASLRHRGDAIPRLVGTEEVLLRTVVDTSDAAIRSFVAETWAGLGKAYLDVRGDGATSTDARSDCAAAFRLLGRAEVLLSDMIRRQQASNTDSVRLTATRAERSSARARCPG